MTPFPPFCEHLGQSSFLKLLLQNKEVSHPCGFVWGTLGGSLYRNRIQIQGDRGQGGVLPTLSLPKSMGSSSGSHRECPESVPDAFVYSGSGMLKSIVYSDIVAHRMLLIGHPDSELQELPHVDPDTYTFADRHLLCPVDIQMDFRGSLVRVLRRVGGTNPNPCLAQLLSVLEETL